MEHLTGEYLNSDDVLVAEHRHRYLWAARYVSGRVLDLACGYGYGGEILTRHAPVSSYVGIDASDEAVAHANRKFASAGRKYIHGSATAIPLDQASIDSIVSLETLEHLIDPAAAILEFKRVLVPGGLVVGSVPSKYFDDRAEQVYGENPYHVTRFSYSELVRLLSSHFATVRIYYSALEVISHIGSLVDGKPVQTEQLRAIRDSASSEVSGSFHFVATDRVWEGIDDKHGPEAYFCTDLIELEARRVAPLRQLVAHNEDLVLQKDAIIRDAEQLITQRDERIRAMDQQIRDLQAQLENQPLLVKYMSRAVRRVLALARRANNTPGRRN